MNKKILKLISETPTVVPYYRISGVDYVKLNEWSNLMSILKEIEKIIKSKSKSNTRKVH